MFSAFGTVSFTGVFGQVPSGGSGVATALGFLLLLGACGKSAQVPLQSWLLDAMEGPTPVSALIHAATMVTAGVYLLVRSNPILAVAPDARVAIAVVGTVTLLFGGIIASAKDDIKKSLAGSTMSQIGYMTLGAGLGPEGYVFSIALLLAHGFYKAGLFLGAGSVIHGMNDEQDMRRYGALARSLPVTYVTFGLAYLAIAGIPPFSGFFVKDPIIEGDFTEHGAGGWILGILALIGAGLTAFYMTRMMFMTWWGKRRWAQDAHPHESPPVMTWPMIVLAIGSVGAGGFLIINDRLQDFLAPVVGVPPVEHGFFTVAGGVALLLALAGIALGWAMYGRAPVPETAPRGNPLTVAARNELYGNTINESLVMRPGQWLTRLSVYFDNRGVDGLVNSLAALVGGTSGRWRRLQTGFVRSYALSMFFGAVVVVALLLAVRL
jgi:NADH-quinone oxidoreductase subunit L